MIGRDPWKPDEAYSFGLVYHILQTGDWVVLTSAGEPFMEKPPIFFLTAAFFARAPADLAAAARWRPHGHGVLHGAHPFLVTGLSARRTGTAGVAGRAGADGLHRPGRARARHDHLHLPARRLRPGNSMGWCCACAGRCSGGLWLGTGVGLGFLSKGLLAPGCLGIIALALPALSPSWRTRSYVADACGSLRSEPALAAGLALAPAIKRSPDLFYQWFWVNNFGRFLGARTGSAPRASPATT